MVVKADISALKQASWLEYAIRFLFGGLMTVIAGLIAKHYGPGLGGLFLAFPAIAPAAATMIDQHAKEQRQRAGLEGHTRGRKTAALDMFGTVWGSVGLLAFGTGDLADGPVAQRMDGAAAGYSRLVASAHYRSGRCAGF